MKKKSLVVVEASASLEDQQQLKQNKRSTCDDDHYDLGQGYSWVFFWSFWMSLFWRIAN